jgi:hypothetical protein
MPVNFGDPDQVVDKTQKVKGWGASTVPSPGGKSQPLTFKVNFGDPKTTTVSKQEGGPLNPIMPRNVMTGGGVMPSERMATRAPLHYSTLDKLTDVPDKPYDYPDVPGLAPPDAGTTITRLVSPAVGTALGLDPITGMMAGQRNIGTVLDYPSKVAEGASSVYSGEPYYEPKGYEESVRNLQSETPEWMRRLQDFLTVGGGMIHGPQGFHPATGTPRLSAPTEVPQLPSVEVTRSAIRDILANASKGELLPPEQVPNVPGAALKTTARLLPQDQPTARPPSFVHAPSDVPVNVPRTEPSLRQRIRDFKGGGIGESADKTSPLRPSYMATPEEIAAQTRTPEQLAEEKAARKGVSPELREKVGMGADESFASFEQRVAEDFQRKIQGKQQQQQPQDRVGKQQQQQPQDRAEQVRAAQKAARDRVIDEKARQLQAKSTPEGIETRRRAASEVRKGLEVKDPPHLVKYIQRLTKEAERKAKNAEKRYKGEKRDKYIKDIYMQLDKKIRAARAKRTKEGDAYLAQRQSQQSYIKYSTELKYVTGAKDAGELDRAVRSFYEDRSLPSHERYYYSNLESYLNREDPEHPKRNTMLDTYYTMTGNRIGIGVPIDQFFQNYVKHATGLGKYRTQYKHGNKFYIKDDRAFRSHLYRYGKRLTEDFGGEVPDWAAPWVVDEETDTVHLNPYVPSEKYASWLADSLPPEAGLKVQTTERALTPEVPKGRVPQQAKQPQPPRSPWDGLSYEEKSRLIRKARERGIPPEDVEAEYNRRVGGEAPKGPQAIGGEPGAPSGPTPPLSGEPIPPNRRTPAGPSVTDRTMKSTFGPDKGRHGASGFKLYESGKSGQKPPFINPAKEDKFWHTVENLTSPSTPSKTARDAAQLVRAIEGRGRRQIAKNMSKVEPYMKEVSRLSREAKRDLVHFIQTGGEEGDLSALQKAYPEFTRKYENLTRALASLFRSYRDEIDGRWEKDANGKWKRVGGLEKDERANWYTNYLPQMYKNVGDAKLKATTFLKQRHMPSYKYALEKHGIEPRYEDPIEMGMAYMSLMRKYLDIRHIVREGQAAGYIREFDRRKRPQPGTGVIDYARGGKQFIANEDFARVFNNYVSKGFRQGKEVGGLYNGLLRLANGTTSIVLGLAGFHTQTMLGEAFMAAMADAAKDAAQGKFGSSFKRFINATKAPYEYFKMGDELINAYNELSNFGISPKLEQIADLLARSNMRVGDLDEVYRATAMGNYFKNIVRSLKAENVKGIREALSRPGTLARETAGAVAREAKQSAEMFRLDPGKSALRNPLHAAKRWTGATASVAGQIIETAAFPLFYHYIPRLKAGVFKDRMGAWLEENPTAKIEEQVAASQKIADVIDDQFGEMAQNNIFWDNHLKQTLNVLATSTGWNLGTYRLLAQGTADIIKGSYEAARGRSQPLTDRAAYTLVIGTIGVTTIGAVYTALKAGVNASLGLPVPPMPQDYKDFVFPRTGGKDSKGSEERAVIPGYLPGVIDLANDPTGTMYNKLNAMTRTTLELLMNKDWEKDPVYRTDSISHFTVDVAKRIAQNYPIAIKSALNPTSTQTNITAFERLMGTRATGQWLTNPELHKRIDDYYKAKDWAKKKRHDLRDERKRGGSTPPSISTSKGIQY